MKRILILAGTAVALSVPVAAQTTMPPATTTPPAAATAPAMPPAAMPSKDAGAPLPGANSFTEAQARSRIEQLGYTAVTGLAKDANGIWRGKASKGGQIQDVSLDFRGNIVIGQK